MFVLVSGALWDNIGPAGYELLRLDLFGSTGAQTRSDPCLIASGLVLFQHATALYVNMFIPPVNPRGCILRTNTQNSAVLGGCVSY